MCNSHIMVSVELSDLIDAKCTAGEPKPSEKPKEFNAMVQDNNIDSETEPDFD